MVDDNWEAFNHLARDGEGKLRAVKSGGERVEELRDGAGGEGDGDGNGDDKDGGGDGQHGGKVEGEEGK